MCSSLSSQPVLVFVCLFGHSVAGRILVPERGSHPGPRAVEAQRPDPWTPRELPIMPVSFNAAFCPCHRHSFLIYSHCFSVHTVDLFPILFGVPLDSFLQQEICILFERSKHILTYYYACLFSFHFHFFVSFLDLYSGSFPEKKTQIPVMSQMSNIIYINQDGM